MFVVEPDKPAVPMFIALVTPVVVAPVPKPYVEAAVELPTVTVAFENVVLPVKFCVVFAKTAIVPVAFGSVYDLVVPVEI